MPTDRQVDSPTLVASRIESNPAVSQLTTLLGQRGSQVRPGNLLVVPVENSLLYFRSLYVQAENNPIPVFQRAIAVSGQEVAIAPDVPGALAQLSGTAATPAPGENEPPQPNTPLPEGGGPGGSADELLVRAQQAFAAADAALARSDLAEYQRRVNEARALVDQAARASGPPNPTATTVPPTQA